MGFSDRFSVSDGPVSFYSSTLQYQLLRDLLGARSDILISSFIMSPAPSVPSHPVTSLLSAVGAVVAEHGVCARVILNHLPRRSNYDVRNISTIRFLSSLGIQCRWNVEPKIQHSKIVIIDEKILYIGSHNWTAAAFSNPYEISARLYMPALASSLLARFNQYWDELFIRPSIGGLTWH